MIVEYMILGKITGAWK